MTILAKNYDKAVMTGKIKLNATYQTKVTATKVKKLYQPYYSHRGHPTKEEQAESIHQEQKRLRGSGFLGIPHDSDFRSSPIESTK